jgi:predicted membrane protein
MITLLLILILLVLIFKGSSKYLPHTFVLIFVVWLFYKLKDFFLSLPELFMDTLVLWIIFGSIGILLAIGLVWQKVSDSLFRRRTRIEDEKRVKKEQEYLMSMRNSSTIKEQEKKGNV